MARITRIGRGAVRKVHAAVDELFDRAKTRLLSPEAVRGKQIMIGYQRELSLPGIFEAGSLEEGVKPDLELLQSLLDIAGGYVDAVRERTKTRIVHEINAAIADTKHGAIDPEDFRDLLNTKLTQVFGEVTNHIHSIVDTEGTRVKNTSVLDGIIGSNLATGVSDPVCYFVVVRDGDLCDECKRLHLMDDGKTPRVWKLSELGHGYHKKGEDTPKIGGLHPHCRCTLVTLMPGFGFNKQGMVSFKKRGHLEFEAQRGMEKSEPLFKAWDPAGHPRNLKGQFVVSSLSDGHHEVSDNEQEAEQQLKEFEEGLQGVNPVEHLKETIEFLRDSIKDGLIDADPEWIKKELADQGLLPDDPGQQQAILNQILGIRKAIKLKAPTPQTLAMTVKRQAMASHRTALPSKDDFFLAPVVSHNQLFRAAKFHTLHHYSQALRYLVHRLEHANEYQTPEGEKAADAAFMGGVQEHLNMRVAAGKKVPQAPMPIYSLRAFIARLPMGVIQGLLDHKNSLREKLLQHHSVKMINGIPHVALTRGMTGDNRQRDPVLSSYADSKQYVGGDVTHHFTSYVPIDHIWGSFDHASHDAHRIPYRSAEDEYLVSPHDPIQAPDEALTKLIERKPPQPGAIAEQDAGLPEQHSTAPKMTFVTGADRRSNVAAGALLYSKKTGRFLVAKRGARVHNPGTWGTIGGFIGGMEDPQAGAEREIREETRFKGPIEFHHIYTDEKPDLKYHNYLGVVDDEFDPKTNWETAGHSWVKLQEMPKPLHPGLQSLLTHGNFQSTLNKVKTPQRRSPLMSRRAG